VAKNSSVGTVTRTLKSWREHLRRLHWLLHYPATSMRCSNVPESRIQWLLMSGSDTALRTPDSAATVAASMGKAGSARLRRGTLRCGRWRDFEPGDDVRQAVHGKLTCP